MPAPVDLTGRRFGKLVVLKLGARRNEARVWICLCDCNTTTSVIGRNLGNGHTRSCGCARVHHGEYAGDSLPSPELAAWRAMIARCSNPKNRVWHNYGGRGIRVCDRWSGSFKNFLSDMGRRPSDRHSIDRVNNDGNYEPSNCRWALAVEQSNNRRGIKRIVVGDVALSAPEWSRITGIHKDTIHGRIERGWDPELAVSAAPDRSMKGRRYAFAK